MFSVLFLFCINFPAFWTLLTGPITRLDRPFLLHHAFFLFFITVAHVAHLALCLNHYLLFMFGSPSPWKLLHVWQRAFEESESGGVQQRGLRALRNWPTSSVIMAGSWNEAFGSTPGFREQRCEPLMLAAEPAWHLLPFPSSPCHGCLPSLPPSLPPSPAGTAKRIWIKKESCFSPAPLLQWHHLCSLQPPDSRRPAHFFCSSLSGPPFWLNSSIL